MHFIEITICHVIYDRQNIKLSLSHALLYSFIVFKYVILKSHFQCFHEYLWICKLDNLHMQHGDNRHMSKL